jgi:hypothetical protein
MAKANAEMRDLSTWPHPLLEGQTIEVLMRADGQQGLVKATLD